MFGTIPNILTMCRMASAPVIAYFILTDQYGLATSSALCGNLVVFSDVVPCVSWLYAVFVQCLWARACWISLTGTSRGISTKRCVFAPLCVPHSFPSHHLMLCLCVQSVLGSFLDPVADKALVSTVMLSLGWQGALSPWFVGLIVARDVALFAGGFVIRAFTKQPGVPFFSTTDASSFQLAPTMVGKVSLCTTCACQGRKKCRNGVRGTCCLWRHRQIWRCSWVSSRLASQHTLSASHHIPSLTG